ncbi:MAG: penicillin acylase family protein [Bacteroidetes bacterium]|nr:MAG: penicillin acylase family protein [Bacteroidota bacterium]
MRWVKFVLSLAFSAFVLYILSRPLTMLKVPFPLGSFLSPNEGFWQNAEAANSDQNETLNLPGLKGEVQVVYDERGVPHIFAKNAEDLYFAQGYVTARDRLWQMEFQTHAAAGRLTEITGRGPDDAVLKMDRYTRRLGMVYAAENLLKGIMENAETRVVAEAYSAGVNAYINSLSDAELPVEYKLLNYRPEPWTPLKSALTSKLIARDLTSGANDLEYTQALQVFGRKIFDVLYPDYPYDLAPIAGNDTKYNKREYLPTPERPAGYFPDSLLMGLPERPAKPEPGLGSNNWAVSGKRSATGRPLLANDPHLGLNLPAIWYEIQLSAPGSNTYGVSLPGAPAIIIGFNDSIAWGITNGGQDVMDYYTITYRDAQRKEVLLDGQWQATQQRVETFVIKGEAPVTDTVIYTHVGPVIFDKNFGDQPGPLAVRWTAHDASDELLCFLKLNRGRNYADYLEAMKQFGSPSQNFVFASASGDIAIRQQGKFGLKWPEQGKFILDGSRRDHIWSTYIPFEQVAHQYNPEQGFVSSANQHPASPAYPYSYVGNFEDFRGRRIYRLLAAEDTVTVDNMKAWQQDNYALAAADVLPLMLAELDTTRFSQIDKEAWAVLKNWDYFYHRESVAATLFERWWTTLYEEIWKDDIEATGVKLDYPDRSTTIRILRDSVNFRFYGRWNDSVRIDRRTLINQSYSRAVGKLHADYPNHSEWTWGKRRGTNITHLTRVLTPFSRIGIETGGNGGILNATNRSSGPSWRMVVSLGPQPEAWGVYPGGQSGNPGSARYGAFIDDWASGQYYSLWYMKQAGDRSRPVSSAKVLRPSSAQ